MSDTSQVNLISDLDADELGRNCVQWQTVVMQLPDDGTGDLIKVSQIIVNDAKSATYKLALLRTLLHIADAHPGAVLSREDNKVRLPLACRNFDDVFEAMGLQVNGVKSRLLVGEW